jgi:hypothetical protein
MDYKKIHDLIIERAANRNLEGYFEKHHIIPKCIGGTDDKTNLIKLTAREHFIIHKLLCEIHPNESGLVYALFMMCNTKNKNRSYSIGAKEYERTKILYSKRLSEDRKNKPTWNKGIPLSDETKQKMSETLKGRTGTFKDKQHSAESKKLMSEANKGNTYRIGKTHTEESKQRMRERALGRTSPNKNKSLSEEHRLKLSNAAKTRKRRPHTEETKLKIKNSHISRKQSKE